MYDQREGSLRGPEEGGTAKDSGFELILVLVEEEMFLTMVIQIFVKRLSSCRYGMAVVFVFLTLRGLWT